MAYGFWRGLVAATLLLFVSAPLTAATIEVVDLAGRTVKVPQGTRKIVMSEGRQLYAIGILDRDDPFQRVLGMGRDLADNDPGAWEKLRAKYPSASKVADMGNPYAADSSAEKITSLGTELYILDLSNYFKAKESGLLDKLDKAGVTTVFIDFRQDPTQNTLPSILLLGRILDRQAEAAAFADYYLAQTRRVFTRVGALPDNKRPLVFVERAAGLLPCCATFGPANYGKYVEEAGGRNWGSRVFSGFAGEAALEKVLADDPDVYLVTGASWAASNPGTKAVSLGYDATPEKVQAELKALTERPGMAALKAIKGKKVMAFYHQFYNAPYYFIAELAIAKALHPDLFKDVDPEAEFRTFHQRFMPIEYSGVFWTALQ